MTALELLTWLAIVLVSLWIVVLLWFVWRVREADRANKEVTRGN